MTKAGENPGAGYDVVVIGGGHNGLVCANYLARGGRSVLLLEANARLGGAAVTREFAPGYQVSAGAHLLHLMPSEMIGALKLESHGLAWAGTHLPTTALIDGSEPLAIAAQLAGGATAA